ncbi:phosphodiesterase [beta proteobacterium AAP51]|nr:phosphodiesterase [beta proteobacterium AAP51]
MLKKIAIDQLRLGMHLHKLEGPWLKHPFWRTRFVIESTEDLAQLRACGLKECWIDNALGLDVAQPETPEPAPVPSPSLPAVHLPAVTVAPPAHPREPQPMREELRQAAAICDRSREAVTQMFNEARMGRAVDAEGCLPLVDDISSSVLRNPGALVSLARLKTADDYSYMHSVAVCALMVALGRQIGMKDDECRMAGLAGLMHDIGKAVMPLDVLNKPGKLTDDEFNVIRSHPMRGHQLLTEGKGATPEMLDVVLHHHERPDGKGYPMRLAGDQLSRLARMGAICDVYDAITSNRPYKAGWDPAESIAKMVSWKGQFDENLLAAFVQSLGIYPTGSVVKLQSGRLAVVVEQNPGKLVAPVVKAFYSTKSEMRITPERIDLSRPGCHERIVARHGQDAKSFPGLDELWVEPEVLQRLAV